MTTTKPRVLVLADTENWAWGRKARAYAQHLSADWSIDVQYQVQGVTWPAAGGYDLVHCFEFPQAGHVPPEHRARGGKIVVGLTANVWRTWGRDKVRAWAAPADGIHANSRLVLEDLQAHVFTEPGDPPLWYCPNGVDAEFWRRTESHPDHLIAAHVGKPNLRKGAPLIIDACRHVGVTLKLVQRTAKLALPAETMRAFYQGVSLQVTASNMDATPNPMLEGAACGNALLSTPVGNMVEFITHLENGVHLPPLLGPAAAAPEYSVTQMRADNPRLLAALTDWLAWMRDHYDVVRAMGAAARRTVEQAWTWPHQVRHVDAMWKAVIG